DGSFHISAVPSPPFSSLIPSSATRTRRGGATPRRAGRNQGIGAELSGRGQRSVCCSSGKSSCQGASSHAAAIRAGETGGPVVGRPRCSRISFTIFFSVTKASTTRRPPQGHTDPRSRPRQLVHLQPGIVLEPAAP